MKKRLATLWLAGCSGCHMSLLDIDERILEIVKLADIIKCPIMDGKDNDFENIDIAIVEGAVGSDEHFEEIKHVRKHSKVLVALGDCAVMGNVSAMRNHFSKAEIMARAYGDTDADKEHYPGVEELQQLTEKVVPLHDIVKVDYYIPGCPPSADVIFAVLNELLNDREPSEELKKELRYG